MGDISDHFNRWEFACRCGCGFDACDIELVGVLENLRRHFERPVTVASGCRCKKYNSSIPGAAKKSQHILAKAVDIHVQDVSPELVASYLEQTYPDRYGIGRYNTWTHIDVRPVKTRWDKRT